MGIRRIMELSGEIWLPNCAIGGLTKTISLLINSKQGKKEVTVYQNNNS